MPYIDALRGLAIIFVVFGHIELFSFFDFQYTTIIGRFFAAIQLPLFFFISGFCSHKPKRSELHKLILRKFAQLVVPAFAVGMLYTFLFLGVGFENYFSNASKLGYWFPISLFEMFCIYYCCEWIRDRTSNNKRDILILVLVSLFLYGMKLPFKTIPFWNTIGNYTSLHYTLGYFQFFAAGILFRRYIHIIAETFQSHAFMTVTICLLFCCFILQIFANQHLDSTSIEGQICITIVETVIAYPAVYVLYAIFYMHLKNAIITNLLQYIGKRTMDIYLLHYFLLPTLPMVGYFLRTYHNVVIELLLGFILSVIICLISIGLGKVIRLSPMMSKYLLGVRCKETI